MIIFLHARISGYFLSCIRTLSTYTEEQIHVYKHPLSAEAPFQEKEINRVVFHNRETFSTQQLIAHVRRLQPDIIFCSGWFDKGYLKVCRSFKNEIPIVLTMDNQWQKTFRQYLGCLANRLFHVLECFSSIWVPGEPQKVFAKKLGFHKQQICTGYYTADIKLFNELFLPNEDKPIPKRFIFVGRYVEIKGISELWDAFIRLTENEQLKDWELWCFGQGPLFEKKVIHPQIKHLGFVQPDKMEQQMGDGGILVLPSYFEPWGLVVHEFAVAGFPLICSTAVGAASEFVIPDRNGYIVDMKDPRSLYEALKKMTEKSDEELRKMRVISHKTGMSNTPDLWAKKVLAFKNPDTNASSV